MSNAKTRKFIERQSAPVVAFLIDNGWVQDECGILNSHYSNVREGVLIASCALNGARAVPVPAMRERL